MISKIISKLIKLLIRLRLRVDHDWLGTSYGIDDLTNAHVIIETFRDGYHYFGTKRETFEEALKSIGLNMHIDEEQRG